MNATRIHLTISVADDHRGRFNDVVAALERAGLDVESAIDSLGVITGSTTPAGLEAVKQVPGVAHVEHAREYRIAPPESEVQ